MKVSIAVATFLLAGAGLAGIGAVNPIESPLLGSDTLFHVTQDALATVAIIGPASTYIGGGSDIGQGALVSGTQHVAPMSRMFDDHACGADAGNATGIVVGLDAVEIFAAGEQGANPASCNSPGNGLAIDTVNGQGFSNYKDVLALVYGGLDNITHTVDCNSARRNSVVSNWSALFENSCSNTDLSCNNAAHTLSCSVGGTACSPAGSVCNMTGTCVSSGTARLWHAFRMDDASGTSEVFASILGLTPEASAWALRGFGTSPFCNALNWDASAANALCSAGAGKQFLGPGGVPQGFCSVSTNVSCVIGASFCGTGSPASVLGMRCLTNAQCASGSCVMSNDPCPAGETCQPLSGDAHRRPPLNTWGDDPDPNTNPRCNPAVRACGDADVLPTSHQDNDPIRRPCIGSRVNTIFTDGEEVCNRDHTLGLVLPVPASDFIAQIPDPTHPGQNLVQFPNNACNDFILGFAPRVRNCAPLNAAVHYAECPNGDSTFGSSFGCYVPVDDGTFPFNNTSQCLQPATGFPPTARPMAAQADYRVHNLHMRDGTMGNGTVGYVREAIPNTPTTTMLDFAGAFDRIHQVTTIPAAGAGHVGGCTLSDSTDQIACLAHADHCSIGSAGAGGRVYSTRYANGTCAVGGQQCSVNGSPCSYLGVSSAGPCQVAAQFPAIASGPILVNRVAPSVATIQALGNGSMEYPFARKLYLNSLNFGFGVDAAGNPSSGGFTTGITAAELILAQFESMGSSGLGPLLVNDGFFSLGPTSPNGTDKPFCEDFNTTLVCGPSVVNDNACARMPAALVLNGASGPGLPGDPSAVPSAASTSTVCGNGVVEPFEECDPAAPPAIWHCTIPGAASCSTTCRC